jgi:hypothetical protein
MQEPSKRIKRLLREHAAKAHEEELRRALPPLAAAFEDWKAGNVDRWDLCDRIHEFHQGPACELFKCYVVRQSGLDLPVAFAIATGILDRDQVPPELLEHLSRALAFYESQGIPESDG